MRDAIVEGFRLASGTESETERHPIPTEDVDLAHWLAREFEAPVGLRDLNSSDWVVRLDEAGVDFPEMHSRALAASGASGRISLWRSESGPVWLVLPIVRPGRTDLAAWIGFAGSTDTGSPLGACCPERALRAWGREIADLIRAEARPNPTASAENLAQRERTLADRLLRRMKVSDPPERFQHMATTALRDALNVEAVAWVPSHHREPVVVAGALTGLRPDAYRDLVSNAKHETVKIVNGLSDPKLPGVRQVAFVVADIESSAGWLVVVNSRDGRNFASREIESIQPIASMIGSQRGNARLYADLKDLIFGVIRSLTAAIDAKDPYTSGHSERVARIAVRIAEELGMSPAQRGDLYLMGLMHDVGKIGVADGLLKKQGSLTHDEFLMVQAHVRIGIHILKDLKKLHHLMPGVAHHHESLDGTGYPSGLKGDAIPLVARILAVADSFDAMSSTRPYRRRMTSSQIDTEFRARSGIQWDPQVVAALFACRADLDRIRQKGLGESLNRVVDDTLNRNEGSSRID